MREALAATQTGILCKSLSAGASFYAAISNDLVVTRTAEADTLAESLGTAVLKTKSRRTPQ